jgi:hypothetical protein
LRPTFTLGGSSLQLSRTLRVTRLVRVSGDYEIPEEVSDVNASAQSTSTKPP